MAANNPQQKQKLTRVAISKAYDYMQKTNDSAAFSSFLIAFKMAPNIAASHQTEFLDCLGRLIQRLRELGRKQDILKCQHEACMAFPGCPDLLNTMGSELFSLGFMDEAASYFRKALRTDATFVLARQNLEHLCSHLVERWHYHMLNDKTRNESFKDAIHKAVQAGYNKVLDIGCGTGLLSMFAVTAGAASVTGCEMSKTMYDISCDCVSTNLMSDKIKLIQKKSTELIIPNDITERMTLLVTETFDAGLLGEHILTTLNHAWENLLVNTDTHKARVIPGGATVYMCAIESETIRKQNRAIYPGCRHLEFGNCQFVCATHKDMEDADRLSESEGWDPYTCHRLTELPGGYKQLTRAVPLKRLDFNDPQSIQQYMKGYSDSLTLTFISHGQIDAIAMWFDLELDDSTTLSSAPDANSCWEQAVFPVLSHHLEGYNCLCSLFIRKEDELNIFVQCRDNAFHLQRLQINRHQAPESSDKAVSCLSENEHISTCPSPSYVSMQNFILTRDELSRLNDLTWNHAFCQALEEIKLGFTKSNKDFKVLTTTKDMTTLPLQAIKIGATNACILCKDYYMESVIGHLADQNNIKSEDICYVDCLERVDPEWSVLLVDVVEPCGTLRPQILEDVALARMTCLVPDSVVIPNKVSVYGILVESESLLRDSRMTTDDNTLGIKVANNINDFQMSHHVDLCLSTLEHKKLSQPFCLFTLDLSQPLAEDSGLEGTFLHQDNLSLVPITEPGQIAAVVYWFDLCLSDSVSYSTLDSNSHIQQGAILQREPLSVEAGIEVSVQAMCKNSCIDVTLLVT